MHKRFTEEMKLWLFDLAHGNLEEEAIIKGFIKHYALHGYSIENVMDDIHFHTVYGERGIRTAKNSLEHALRAFSEK